MYLKKAKIYRFQENDFGKSSGTGPQSGITLFGGRRAIMLMLSGHNHLDLDKPDNLSG